LRGAPDGGRSIAGPGAAEQRDCLVAGGAEADRLVDPGQLQEAGDLRPRAAEGEAALALGKAPLRLDHQAEAGGVDEVALGEVDEERVVAAVEGLVERVSQLRGGRLVELAEDAHRLDSVLQGLPFDLEVRLHAVPFNASRSRVTATNPTTYSSGGTDSPRIAPATR